MQGQQKYAHQPVLLSSSKTNISTEISADFRIAFKNPQVVFLQASPNRRVKRDDDSLEKATERGDYSYWLSQEDIADIVRLESDNYKRLGIRSEFEVIGLINAHTQQLVTCLRTFQARRHKKAGDRLTLIINLWGLHWVTLVIEYQDSYIGYYVDSKDLPLPPEYYRLLLDQFHIQPISLSPGFPQQTDDFNCGLWVLENAYALNAMLDSHLPLYWLTNELGRLKQRCDKNYFDQRRRQLSERLRMDPIRQEHLITSHETTISNEEPDPKRSKLHLEEEKKGKLNVLLETFVETFLGAFVKRLAAYHLAAKDERLTEAALKAELKVGVTGALIGVAISQSLMGAIPSVTTSVRGLGSKYFLSDKEKAQKITKVFSEIAAGDLSHVLAEAAVAIFASFESQFMQVTDKAGDKMAMEKLAEDAVDRIVNFIAEHASDNLPISKELLERSLLMGQSEKLFDPGLKCVWCFQASGNTIQDKNGEKINTAKLYKNVGLIVTDARKLCKFYKHKGHSETNYYGYRRPFDWEQQASGRLQATISEDYQEVQFPQAESLFQRHSREYDYVQIDINQRAASILNKIQNRFPMVEKDNHSPLKNSILFDLREPIKNFVGRVEALQQLHHMLSVKRATALIPALSTLSIHRDASSSPRSSQTSVSGLGGIGKTQLALRYAQLYAASYDHNVLWIHAETNEDLSYSFYKLATKLYLETKDRYGQDKSVKEVVELVYEYFSDQKSLFIFDNVEDYQAIEDYLPQTIRGISPTILITSRYHNWEHVASVFSLDVFNEAETNAFIKQELLLKDNSQDGAIEELYKLLQGLPLALQQVVAYIKLKRTTQIEFGIADYIALYEEKKELLLNFDFSIYSNDPYFRTVFTTWQITLDKIQRDPCGKDAIGLLNIMAYLDPDHISNDLFYPLQNINLDAALQLLKSYSMINQGSRSHKSTIHRLVQEVIRINLERDSLTFVEVARQIEELLISNFNDENNFHYLHFLLYMSGHSQLESILLTGKVSKGLFNSILHRDIKYLLYFLDLSFIRFPKKKYLRFLADSIVYCMKTATLSFLTETLTYIEKKWREGRLSKENIKYVLEYAYRPADPIYSLKRLSSLPEKRDKQRKAITLVYQFKSKVFGNHILYDICSAQWLKRSINPCFLSAEDKNQLKAIKTEKIKLHLKKLAQLADWMSATLVTKAPPSLLQGDFDIIGMDFQWIVETFLGQLSEQLRMQGEALATDQAVLGKAMQVASPFVARGTSIFLAYNLWKAGNKTALSDRVATAIQLGIEGVEAGIKGSEFLGFVTGVSELTNPIGIVLTSFTWLAADIYHAKQQVAAIERSVHLSQWEKLIQHARAFFRMAPSEYLEAKSNNNYLLQRGIHFLKKYTKFKYYIFPAYHSTTLYQSSKVFLDKKRKFILDESMPDKPKSGRLFCLSNTPQWTHHIIFTLPLFYRCEHAIGLKYLLNRSGNIAFINLGEGDDEVIARSFNAPMLFIVQNGNKTYKGSDEGNQFILSGHSTTGLLQGGHKKDAILIKDFHPGQSLLHDRHGFLCRHNNSKHARLLCPTDDRLKLIHIERIYGRADEQDIIYLNSHTDFIDGYGGNNEKNPDLFIVTNQTHPNPRFVLRHHSTVFFRLKTGVNSVDYRIPAEEIGEAWVQFDARESMQHRFFFEVPLQHIVAITVKDIIDVTIANPFTADAVFSVLIVDPYAALLAAMHNQTGHVTELSNTAYFFPGVEIKLFNNDRLYVKEIEYNNQTLAEKINLFLEMANRLDKSFSLQLMDNTLILIGKKGKHEIFYITGLYQSHVIGNEGENVYVVAPSNATLFPLAEITLYDSAKGNIVAELADTLDLRELIQVAERIYSNQVIFPDVVSSGNDLILQLNTQVDNVTWPIASIKLKDALNGWNQRLDIFFNSSIPQNIVALDNEKKILVQAPLVIGGEKEVVWIETRDIEQGMEIIVLKNIGNFDFFRNDTNLILSNIGQTECCTTIIYHQFYQNSAMKEKVLSTTLSFFDHEIDLHDQQDKINQAIYFSTVVARLNPMRRMPTPPPFIQGQFDRQKWHRARREVIVKERKSDLVGKTANKHPLIQNNKTSLCAHKINQNSFFNKTFPKIASQNSKIHLNLSTKYQPTLYENSFLAKWLLYFFGYSSMLERMNQLEQQVPQDSLSALDWAEQHLNAEIARFDN